MQQLSTSRNNTQHGVETLATSWAQQCCERLHGPFHLSITAARYTLLYLPDPDRMPRLLAFAPQLQKKCQDQVLYKLLSVTLMEYVAASTSLSRLIRHL